MDDDVDETEMQPVVRGLNTIIVERQFEQEVDLEGGDEAPLRGKGAR